MVHTYKDLIVWQKAMEMVTAVYLLTEKFPAEELYGLTSQMRRSAVSVPSNIAEGKLRGSAKEFRQFLLIAYGSAGELETQIELARRLPKTDKLDYTSATNLLEEVMKMLNTLIKQSSTLTPKA
ncbi:MAG: S23 ribosomal protein [Candidatus Uhrbacteria bacterium GW2011_GWA2_53_10]|uniref:S23 ribosomal protein n=1 Tax=Candidatus Uhrbacteria bacterium GW2011_GWA2_53_10 TaxID=1618980 RepID=A0A0G1XQZ8_9BACT|nr:MAG: S23 ribosomal protein [Candidatus Uhrbacteria bacterium GW2011_GWA2_53_10]